MKKKELHIPHHNRTVHGWFYEPDAETYPLVIMSHGYNGYETDFEQTAEYFVKNGIGAVCYTFCGGSTRDISGFATSEMTLFTESEDLCAVLDEVKGWKRVADSQIFLFGASQGGMVSAIAAAGRRDEVRGLILLFPALCIPDNWNERFPEVSDIPEKEMFWDMELGRQFFVTLRDFEPFAFIKKYTGPVLLMQGDKDPVIPVSYCRRAFQEYRDARLEIFCGEGHGFTEQGDRRMEAMALYFIHDCIKENR